MQDAFRSIPGLISCAGVMGDGNCYFMHETDLLSVASMQLNLCLLPFLFNTLNKVLGGLC